MHVVVSQPIQEKEKKVMDDPQINKCVCYEKRLHTEPLHLHLQIKDNGYFQNFTGTCHENFWTLPKEVSLEWKLIKTQLVIGSPVKEKEQELIDSRCARIVIPLTTSSTLNSKFA